MEPSRERDGDLGSVRLLYRRDRLQWSRRANATETFASSFRSRATSCGFNGAVARTRRRLEFPGVNDAYVQELQWSRRANATETWRGSSPTCGWSPLQWSRRAN